MLKSSEKISLIKKYYKKDNLFLELKLLNYSGYNLYIILTESKKYNVFKLCWFDLDDIKDKKIDKYISQQYINSEIINLIEKTYSEYPVDSHYIDKFLTDKNTVIFNANLKTKTADKINVSFNNYIPKNLDNLTELFIFIFKNMPRAYEGFLYKLLAKITGNTEMYEYKEEFDFDLFNDDMDSLFHYHISERGKKYYEEERVKFLEKFDDKYFAIVEGTKKYVVIIKYDDKEKKTQVYCSCPCEFYCKHIYAVMMSIRNHKFNNFYKIMYENDSKSLLERIIDFEYILCIGLVGKNFEIVNNYGEIELFPIFDKNNEYHWVILEDSTDKLLQNELNQFIKNQ